MRNLKISETLTAKKVVKFMLAGSMMVTSAFALTGCSNKDTDKKENAPVEEVVSEQPVEKTPYELELESLQDFQVTDKTYPNEDLERYNKIQGYVYQVTGGLDSHEELDWVPPTNTAYFEQFAGKYELQRYVILPCYFVRYRNPDEWLKMCPLHLGDTDPKNYFAVEEEYKFISDEELDKIFSSEVDYESRQFTLKNS